MYAMQYTFERCSLPRVCTSKCALLIKVPILGFNDNLLICVFLLMSFDLDRGVESSAPSSSIRKFDARPVDF